MDRLDDLETQSIFPRQTTVLHNRALRSVARTAACARIAQDRTMNSIDCALQIHYWRNGRVELRPPLGRALFVSSAISIPTFFHPHGDTNVPTTTTTQDSAYS